MNTPNKGSRISLVTLMAGDLVVELAPEIGGSVASFRTCQFGKIVDLMRPMSEKARVNRNPGGAAMFPMVPFANRIAGNRFSFEGHTYQFETKRSWRAVHHPWNRLAIRVGPNRRGHSLSRVETRSSDT